MSWGMFRRNLPTKWAYNEKFIDEIPPSWPKTHSFWNEIFCVRVSPPSTTVCMALHLSVHLMHITSQCSKSLNYMPEVKVSTNWVCLHKVWLDNCIFLILDGHSIIPELSKVRHPLAWYKVQVSVNANDDLQHCDTHSVVCLRICNERENPLNNGICEGEFFYMPPWPLQHAIFTPIQQ